MVNILVAARDTVSQILCACCEMDLTATSSMIDCCGSYVLCLLHDITPVIAGKVACRDPRLRCRYGLDTRPATKPQISFVYQLCSSLLLSTHVNAVWISLRSKRLHIRGPTTLSACPFEVGFQRRDCYGRALISMTRYSIRRSACEVLLEGSPPLYVPAGTSIILATLLMQRNLDTWGEDSQKFAPERWLLQANVMEAGKGRNFVPFSAGPRTVSCEG
jgi:hypothetical protein